MRLVLFIFDMLKVVIAGRAGSTHRFLNFVEMSRAKKQKVVSAVADSGTADVVEMKTQTLKGGIPLDDMIPQGYRNSHHILKEGENVWDAKLNFSNSTDNNNKFYFIQLLEPDNEQTGSYYVWTRWGRVGEFIMSSA